MPGNISDSTLKCFAGVKFHLLHAVKQHSHILHGRVSPAFKDKAEKNHKLIILAVTPSLDTASLPGGNEKPPKAVILLIAILAAQHELYFYILKRKPMPHVLQPFLSKGFKARQPQNGTPEFWIVIDFLLLQSTRGKYYQKKKKMRFCFTRSKTSLCSRTCAPFGCSKACASMHFLSSTR